MSNSQHNPNPFDFVPFPTQPILRTKEQFDALGEPVSGYLELTITALTPVHIVGAVEAAGQMRRSQFMRQNDQPCIPAATIRGCLRAFTEALTGGWVSQANDEYRKQFKERHVGFRTFAHYLNHGGSMRGRKPSPTAIDPAFAPTIGVLLDVASYLFGMVVETRENDQAEHASLTRKSRILVEDAYFDSKQLSQDYYVPDIEGDAFMGGGKPSASNWWYFQPREVWNRQVQLPSGRVLQLAEFVGGQFWGRKFYFHQDPQRCIDWYRTEWNYGRRRPQPVLLEAFKAGESTQSFRIYLDRVPEPLARLLLMSLMPGQHIRHKLGYGKAYGYGSISFSLTGAMLRYPNETRIPTALANRKEQVATWATSAWDEGKIRVAGIHELIDWPALRQLALILTWEPGSQLLFTYPPFVPNYFQQPVEYNNQRLYPRTKDGPDGFRIPDSEVGRDVAMAMYRDVNTDKYGPAKKTIHFRVYQENAVGWEAVKKRSP